MYLYFFEGGGWLSIFLSKDMGVAYTRGAAYTSEHGNKFGNYGVHQVHVHVHVHVHVRHEW